MGQSNDASKRQSSTVCQPYQSPHAGLGLLSLTRELCAWPGPAQSRQVNHGKNPFYDTSKAIYEQHALHRSNNVLH
eukprot:jgi/Chrzof1/5644/Cz16g10010.t1